MGMSKHVGDGFAAVLDLEGLTVVARAVARLAVDVDVGQEVHLDLDGAVSGARLAASTLDVEGESTLLVAAHLGLGDLGEELANLGAPDRSWRASATNIRVFNHNPPLGDPWPARFNLRHYPMRSREQMLTRILRDRAGLRRGGNNYHYDNMKLNINRLEIAPQQLHYDDGHSELDPAPIFNWRSIYGYGAPEESTP